MYEFIDRLINIVLPRLRDFHGVKNKAFDKQATFQYWNYRQSVFPELTFEETTHCTWTFKQCLLLEIIKPRRFKTIT